MSTKEYTYLIKDSKGKTVKRPQTWYRKRNKCLAMAHAALIECQQRARRLAMLSQGEKMRRDALAGRKCQLYIESFTLVYKSRKAVPSVQA